MQVFSKCIILTLKKAVFALYSDTIMVNSESVMFQRIYDNDKWWVHDVSDKTIMVYNEQWCFNDDARMDNGESVMFLIKKQYFNGDSVMVNGE